MPAERWWFDPMHAAWEWRGAGWWWLDPMYAAWEWRGAGWWRRRVGGAWAASRRAGGATECRAPREEGCILQLEAPFTAKRLCRLAACPHSAYEQFKAELDVSSELGMDLDLAVVSQEAVDSDGALERVGGMPPLQIAEDFGTRSHFRLGMLSIAHNFGYRGWWFAVRVGELVSDEARARGLDAHISWVVDAVMAGGLPPGGVRQGGRQVRRERDRDRLVGSGGVPQQEN